MSDAEVKAIKERVHAFGEDEMIEAVKVIPSEIMFAELQRRDKEQSKMLTMLKNALNDCCKNL